MRKTLGLMAILWLAVLILVPLGCGLTKVAAVVNGEKIYVSEVEAQLKELKSQYKGMFEGSKGKETEEVLKGQILDSLIEEKLILQEAEKQKIKITTKEVEAKFDQIRGMFKTSQEFRETLKKQGWSEKSLKEKIRHQLLVEKIIDKITKNVKITDSEIKTYYEGNKDRFKEPAQVKASHILLKTKSEAEKVLKEAKGGADFASLAKKYSIDAATKEKSGDLGWKAKEQFVPEFANVAFKLKPGEISEVVKTQFGYHIIKVGEKKEAREKSFEEVRDEIRKILLDEKQNRAFKDWMAGVKKKAKIKKYI